MLCWFNNKTLKNTTKEMLPYTPHAHISLSLLSLSFSHYYHFLSPIFTPTASHPQQHHLNYELLGSGAHPQPATPQLWFEGHTRSGTPKVPQSEIKDPTSTINYCDFQTANC